MSNTLKIDERMAELNPGIPLPSEILDRLLAAGRKLRFEKGQTIHIAGDLTASLSIIIEGEVGFGRVSQEGRNIPASILTAGQSFGELPLFAGVSRTHDATAMTEVVLHFESCSHAAPQPGSARRRTPFAYCGEGGKAVG